MFNQLVGLVCILPTLNLVWVKGVGVDGLILFYMYRGERQAVHSTVSTLYSCRTSGQTITVHFIEKTSIITCSFHNRV